MLEANLIIEFWLSVAFMPSQFPPPPKKSYYEKKKSHVEKQKLNNVFKMY